MIKQNITIEKTKGSWKTVSKFIVMSFLVAFFFPIAPTFSTEVNLQEIALGKQLYFDKNLSYNRTQSCATCHAPNHGFVDQQKTLFKGAVSLGDDGKSFGDRSAPTASYANYIPDFQQREDGKYIGGQFWDGREKNLEGQAGGPPLNPIEMGMPSKYLVVQRIKENSKYVSTFKEVYGNAIFSHTDNIYAALTSSIAAFEKTAFFSPFNSKYDRYLQGNYQLSEEEDLGMTLFFSEQFTNCNQCHQLQSRPAVKHETFTDYTFHNIGVPVNTAVRDYNKSPTEYQDLGLFNHPSINDPKHMGQFKVPTLRNVAVTAPYMHNGVFKELKTVLDFYNKYNSKNKKRQTNPETNEPWAPPEVTDTISFEELESGPALDNKRIQALIAFLKILTDQRFEYLIDKE